MEAFDNSTVTTTCCPTASEGPVFLGTTDATPDNNESDYYYWNYWNDETVNKIYLSWLPLILFIGTISNGLSFLVMTRKRMRCFSCCVYLAVLAVADTVHIWTWGLWYLILAATRQEIDISTLTDCTGLDYFLHHFSQQYSAWILVSITCERFILVYYPLKAKIMCTVNRTIIVCCVLFVILFLLNVHFFFTRETFVWGSYEWCVLNDTKWLTFVNVWPKLDIAVYTFIPSFIILLLNILIINKLRISGSQGHILNSSIPKNTRQITKMLLSVTFLFIALTLPAEIFVIYAEMDPDMYYSSVGLALVQVCKFTNHSINLFLYCMAGTKFRRELKLIFCKDNRVGPEAQQSRFIDTTQTTCNNIAKSNIVMTNSSQYLTVSYAHSRRNIAMTNRSQCLTASHAHGHHHLISSH